MKRGAAPRFALHLQPAAHHLHEPRADREPEPGAAVTARRRAVRLHESFEHPADRPGIHPDARVLHREPEAVAVRPDLDANVTAGWRELDGVGEEIQQHLAKAVTVAGDETRDIAG